MMDLGLDIFRTVGRAKLVLEPKVVGVVNTTDLQALAVEKGSTSKPLQRITDRHHALARNLAAGMGESEAAYICGISLSRVSILKQSPAFQELLEFYREDASKFYKDMHERLANISMDAVQVLHDKLEDDPDGMSVNQLLELVKLGADRTGFGPQTSSTQVNVHVGVADRLEAARARLKERRLRVIEGTKDDG